MAWLDSFRQLKEAESFESLVLRGRLPLTIDGQRFSPSVIERASAVLAAQFSRYIAQGDKSRLIFILPNATQSLGRFLAVSLLLADFVSRQQKGSAFLNGDLLLVTQHIRDCVNLLREVAIRHRSEKLPISSFWPIEVLSQYAAPPDGSNPRVFVANPGWAALLRERRAFGSVVIDVSHPRTGDHLEFLLKQPSIVAAPIQILVIPPWEQSRIDALGEKDRPSDLLWAWDPAAVEAIEQLLTTKTASAPVSTERFIWLADDPEVEDELAEIHSLLVGAMRAGKGRVPGAVLGAWGTYHKLRQLAVPLVALEEERRDAYQTLTVQERIESLELEQPEAAGPVGTYLETVWPRVVTAFRNVYDILLRRREPAKFYTLASLVQEFLDRRLPQDSLRIVAATVHEGNMLAGLLGEIVNGWADALQAGSVSLSTVKEEPRLVAEGLLQPTVLLGFRTSETRYLDVYPTVPVHVVAYPYEAEIDAKIQQYTHASIETLQDGGSRTVLLRQLQFPIAQDRHQNGSANANPRSRRAEIRRRYEIQPRLQRRRFLDDEVIEPLSLEGAVGQNWFEEIAVTESRSGNGRGRALEYSEIIDTEGQRYVFPAARLVDVFRPATEKKERIAAEDLQAGMLMVILVDDPYDDLFTRMIEAMREQQELSAQMALELWEHAKPAALTKHGGSRARLHRSLEAQGLSVDYAAVVGWYRSGDDEILAPGKLEDFAILARASGLYSSAAHISATFNCIQHERSARRNCGRQLSTLLTHFAAGKHYDMALKSANAIGTALEQVAAAVSIREIESARKLAHKHFIGEAS